MIPVAGSIIYITGGSPIKGFDLTPISICIMGVIYAITIFHFGLMDILPTATAVFVKKLSDGFLLLDAEDHIVSLNPATERIFRRNYNSTNRSRLSQIWPELDKIIIDNRSVQHFELMTDKLGIKLYLDISLNSFMDKYNTLYREVSYYPGYN